MTSLRLIALAAALALAGVIAAQTSEPLLPENESPPRWSVGTGFDYTRGDYGFATDTEVIALPLNVAYESGDWTYRLTVPWLQVTGPATVVNGGGTARPTTSSESGTGDAFLSATRRFGEFASGVNVDFTARIKVPVASDARGLGTGEADYYGQLDFYRHYGRLTPFASLGFRVLGDSDLYRLNDGPYASAGTHVRTSDATVVTASFDWRQRLTDDTEHSAEAAVYVTHDLDRRWQVMAYALKGMNAASPDIGAGMQVNYRF